MVERGASVLGMASRVGLACDVKFLEEDPISCREKPSRITTIRQSLEGAGIFKRCSFSYPPYAFHMMMMMMMMCFTV